MRVVADDESHRSTDELSGLDGTDDHLRVAPVVGFEHRRMIASARMRLFGDAPELRIGRYRVDTRLGAGGMGEVYLAHDPELDRQVALKLVLPECSATRAHERLRREARALARLSHTNVVQVYEVGEHLERTFLSMEYVAGRTLEAWLDDDPPHAWRRIIDKFLAAGRGLAAAHRAGVVHRDFKPSNVLLGDDGSVRVADFGLALASAGGDASSGGSLSLDGLSNPVVGTIRYMPLEQLRGDPVDARSDQFAFCVALYEALWHEPPYELGTVARRLEALHGGHLRAPARGRVPAAVWRVVRRGLAIETSDRWPSMDALLHALARATNLRRHALLVGAVVIVAVLGTLASRPTAPDRCAGIDRALAGVWDDAQRQQLQAKFGDAEPLTTDNLTRVLAGLDGWSDAWTRASTRLCEAERDGAVSATLAQLQGTCLTRQRRQVAGLVDAMLTAEGKPARVSAGAVEAVARLPGVEACDALVVAALEPPPTAIAEQVEAVRDQVWLAHELRLLGQYARATALSDDARSRADSLGYGPLRAEAAAEQAKAELDGGSLERGHAQLLAAIDLAEAQRHDRLAAELWTFAAIRTLTDLRDVEAGAAHLRRAEVGWTRVEPDARARAMLHYARGQLDSLRGQLDAAAAEFEAAIDQLGGHDGPELPDYQSALAWVDERRDPGSRRSLDGYALALATAERVWGPHHPNTAVHVLNLALAHDQLGELARTHELFARAIEIWAAAHGRRPHPHLAIAELTLAQLALERGELDVAEARAHSLAAIQAQVLPADDPDRAYPDMLLSAIAGIRGDRATALEYGERALAIWAPSLGPDDALVQHLRSEIAGHLLALGRFDEAERSYLALGLSVPALIGLAELELRRDQPAAAQARLDQLDALAPPELGVHELPYALLRAVTQLRRGHLSDAARLAVHDARTRTPFTAEQLDAWTHELGLTPAELTALDR